jgi:hypothetical protein
MLFIAGCASSVTKDIMIDAQADPKVDFKGYATYTWLGSAAIVYDPDGKWEPPQFDADAEIKFLIDRELRKRGMSEDSVNPDMIVAFAAGIDMASMKINIGSAGKCTDGCAHDNPGRCQYRHGHLGWSRDRRNPAKPGSGYDQETARICSDRDVQTITQVRGLDLLTRERK